MHRTLNNLEILEKGIIKKVNLKGSKKRRFQDLGIVESTTIVPILNSPLKNPRAFQIRGTILAIRNEDADKIEIEERIEVCKK